MYEGYCSGKKPCFAKAIVRTKSLFGCSKKLECELKFSKCNTFGHDLLRSQLKNSISSDLHISGYDFHLFGHVFSISICMNSVVCVLDSHGLHMEFGDVDYIIVDYYNNRAEIWGYRDDDNDSVFMLCLDSAI